MDALGLLYIPVKFSGYSDGILTFKIAETTGEFHQFCIICDDQIVKGESAGDLLDKTGITFFDYQIHFENGPDEDGCTLISKKTYVKE